MGQLIIFIIRNATVIKADVFPYHIYILSALPVS